MKIFTVISFILLSYNAFGQDCCAPKIADNTAAKCTGSAYCSACKNCKYCAHCSSGGSCGVCAPSKRSKASTPSPSKKPIIANSTVRTTPSSLNMRGEPSTSGSIVRKLEYNSLLKVIEIRGKWLKVEVDIGNVGWVYADYVE